MTGSTGRRRRLPWSPSKPVRIISSAAGGILDEVARQLAEQLARALSKAIVENKPGAGNIVAMEAAGEVRPTVTHSPSQPWEDRVFKH